MKPLFKVARSPWRLSAVMMAALLMVTAASPLFAEEPLCKSKNGEVRVVFPDLARRMRIFGTVRLELMLTSNGSVRETKVLGGNPILASAAQQAVKQAKFEGKDACVAVFQFKE